MIDFAHLIGSSVDWLENNHGMPRFEISMTITPPRNAYLYQQEGDIYFAERWDGLVSLFREAPLTQKTYSAYPTTIFTRTDKVELLNPEPVSAGEANRMGIGPYVDVIMLNRDKGYRQSGTVTLATIKKAARNIGIQLRCYTDISGGITWHPWKEEMAYKFERSHRLDI